MVTQKLKDCFIKHCCCIFLLIFPILSISSEVKDLAYGVSAYHFYQKDYFTAISRLMVAEQQQELANESQRAELLKGGIQLAYGLDEQAENVFSTLLSSRSENSYGITDENKQNAWFYLGKLRYQRGEYSSAIKAFNSISSLNDNAVNSSSTYDEMIYLKSLSLLKTGGGNNQNFDQDSRFWPYYLYNLAIHKLQAGQVTAGQQDLLRFTSIHPSDKYHQAIKDRAIIALGFSLLSSGDVDKAMSSFELLSPESLLLENGLLGYGWSLVKSDKYQQAIAPWQHLQQRPLFHPSVQEVHLALPYVYEKLNHRAEALQAYQLAIDAYKTQLTQLNKLREVFLNQKISELFSLSKQEDQDQWLYAKDISTLSEYNQYLSHLISLNSFQRDVKNYRDVTLLTDFLLQANNKLSLLKTIEDQQSNAWQKLIDNGDLKTLENNYKVLNQQFKHIENLVSNISKQKLEITESENAIANEDSQQLWSMIQASENLISELKQKQQDVKQQEEYLSRLKGVLIWQNSERFSENIWQLKKQQMNIKQLLNVSQVQLGKVIYATNNKKQRYFSQRINSLKTEVQNKLDISSTLLSKLDKTIRQRAINELDIQQQRITSYLSQAQLSVARLYDQAVEMQP